LGVEKTNTEKRENMFSVRIHLMCFVKTHTHTHTHTHNYASFMRNKKEKVNRKKECGTMDMFVETVI
jgi:hypothetical protein